MPALSKCKVQELLVFYDTSPAPDHSGTFAIHVDLHH